MVETIPMYTPYGINTKTLIHNTLQLTLSLSSRLIDENTEKLLVETITELKKNFNS